MIQAPEYGAFFYLFSLFYIFSQLSLCFRNLFCYLAFIITQSLIKNFKILQL